MLTRRQIIAGLTAAIGGPTMSAHGQSATRDRPVTILTGAAGLAADGFAMLRGKRVGLLTNHTGRVGNERLIDVMARAPGVTLAAILTPEHGLSGTAEAGAKVAGGVDTATGVKVHSLYGSASNRRLRCWPASMSSSSTCRISARASIPTSRPWGLRCRRRQPQGCRSSCSTGPIRSAATMSRDSCSRRPTPRSSGATRFRSRTA